MKWITHQTGAVLGALALDMPITGIIFAAAGAVLPDVIDQRISGLRHSKRARQKMFNQIHRKHSHWLGWWAGLLMAALALKLPALANAALAGLGVGALSHIALDMLTPRGVPLLPFTRKPSLAIPVCSTGSLGEYVFLSALLCGAGYYFLDRLRPLGAALMG